MMICLFKKKFFYPVRTIDNILISSSMSTPRFNVFLKLKSDSSKNFNTSNAKSPKTVAVIRRFFVKNGFIGDIIPKWKSHLKKKKLIQYIYDIVFLFWLCKETKLLIPMPKEIRRHALFHNYISVYICLLNEL